jgi:hypothetical protein
MNSVEYYKDSRNSYFTYSDVSVELLVNPLLNLEKHVFRLVTKDICPYANRSIGYIFPVSVLDSEGLLPDVSGPILNYMYLAFFELLKRIPGPSIKSTTFSDNFEDNVCVCILDLRCFEQKKPLYLIMHSLRKYQYSYFVEGNTIKAVKSYDIDFYKLDKNIHVRIAEPELYKSEVVEALLRDLPMASNYIHRFVLLYQFIEFLIDVEVSNQIDSKISTYMAQNLPNNDFIDEISGMKKESKIIADIFGSKKLPNELVNEFREACLGLFQSINYPCEENANYAKMLYSFRNLMTHSFRMLRCYEEQVVEVIQYMELMIMYILESYKLNRY